MDRFLKKFIFKRKVFLIFSILSYISSGILFLVGSILFYPKYSTLYKIEGFGQLLGSYLFLLGCIFFFLGTGIDFYDLLKSQFAFKRFKFRHSNSRTSHISLNKYIESLPIEEISRDDSKISYSFILSINEDKKDTHLSRFWDLVAVINSGFYLIASSIFTFGAIYFIPVYYEENNTRGCYSFIIGCVILCISTIWDMLCLSHEIILKNGIKHSIFSLKKLIHLSSITSIGNFFGAILFIFGSYFFLPKFLFSENEEESNHATIFAVDFFVIGSVFFTIASISCSKVKYDGLQETLNQLTKDSTPVDNIHITKK